MKKLLSALLVLTLLLLPACNADVNAPTDDPLASETDSQDSDSEAHIPDDDDAESAGNQSEDKQAMENALKLIPADFTDALEIETRRQSAIINGSSAEQGTATYEAFEEMKELYHTYQDKISDKLDQTQKQLFEELLMKEQQYHVAFDMFSHNALQQYVYTTGRAACNEDYNLIRTKTIMLFSYDRYLTSDEMEYDAFEDILSENFNSFFFFDDDLNIIDGKTIEELGTISAEYAPQLKDLFNEQSQPAFEDYILSFQSYITALQSFEQSIGETDEKTAYSTFYQRLHTAFLYNLYATIADMDYLDEMADNFNLYLNEADYTSKWS